MSKSNVIVLKPTEQTPLSALYCAAFIKETDFPPDVVNIIPGDGPECGYAIAVHAHIDKVACAGSVEDEYSIRLSNNQVDSNTEQGSQINDSQFQWILDFIESDYKFGDKLECGGERVDNKDYFIKATIFNDVKDDMQITHEEIFGSVMSVLNFSVRRGLTLAHQIRPGSIWINTYKTICDQALFDGFKQSDQERELGRYGLEAYYQSDPDKAIEAAEKGFQYDSPWLDVPVRTAHRAVFTHTDQVCFAALRIYVHSTLHDAFVSKSVELAKTRIVGDPFDLTTEQGP
ncbi:unnamed protein product [Rotaria sordida]|uniref:Aldehyde dehydrogenase domain-containing protein n=1 Tax=Rotaria sordida TaxID=392033 RepID=A0A815ZPB5_9BILA|nr:unnamed protein product [Rotaria sordida]CAF1587865.1 unnamed protein product [Rotaria sordida]